MARTNTNEFDTKKHNIFAEGTKIVGNITSDGDIRIDGEIEGEIKTSARVVLGKTSVVNGIISCPNAEILGKFTGKLVIHDTLAIRESAIINGDISTTKLIIDANAAFNGTCNMKQEAEQVKSSKELKFKKEKTA
jgi:cytoskeletal protein CcmA (bactofilin family)